MSAPESASEFAQVLYDRLFHDFAGCADAEAIVRDLADENPWDTDTDQGLYCRFCSHLNRNGIEHDDECTFQRASVWVGEHPKPADPAPPVRPQETP